MNNLNYQWPFIGIVLAALFFIYLGFKRRVGLFSLSGWFALLLPLYMVHQFEEHGIDLFGQRFAFQSYFCNVIGFYGDLLSCPATPEFIIAVNVGTVWILGTFSWLLGVKRPFLGASMTALLFVNGWVHFGSTLYHLSYNPGVATSVLLFLPVSTWVFYLCIKDKVLSYFQLAVALFCGVLIHLVLIGSLRAFQAGLIHHSVLLWIQILNAAFPVALAYLMPRVSTDFSALKGNASC